MRKILVDGLGWSTTDDELKSLFSTHGNVAAALVIRDHVTGQSRGYGFVEMERSCAEQAVEALDGHELNSRPLAVALVEDRHTA